jgi:hypothetical protein
MEATEVKELNSVRFVGTVSVSSWVTLEVLKIEH